MDDEFDLAFLFKDAPCNIDGVEVFAFTDPITALEHVRLNHLNYRVVIADYRMAVMVGTDFLCKVRDINSNITRILISAFTINDKVFEECQCVDKFLQKPISMLSFIEEVKTYLSLKNK